MGRMKLFDDNGDSSDEYLSKIEINHDYAKRLEHNKKREELQRYEELKKQGRINESSEDDSSEEEDDDEELFKPSKKLDSKFFDALVKIKKKDPILNDKDVKLFDSDESDSDSEEKGDTSKKEKKPMYLKDVVSKQLLEAGPDFDDEEDGDDDVGTRVKTYSEEQEQRRKEFLKAVEEEENDEDGELFKVKNDGAEENEEDEGGEEIAEKLDVIFGPDGKLDEDSKFLKDYFLNKMWIDNEKSKDLGDEIEFSEDEEEIENQENYEREFNFRFEENAGDRVMGHSRKVEGSVRKVHNARKLQRERKAERKAQAEFERNEELKHLKNLKRKEINEKLEKIRKVAGIGGDGNNALDLDDLEKDFDPEEYDRKMKDAYGDEYYKANDVDPHFGSDEDDDGLVKPDFDEEDKLLGLSKGWDEGKESSDVDSDFGSGKEDDGSEKRDFDKEDELHGRSKGSDEVKQSSKDGDNEPEEGKRKRKRKLSELEKARAYLMEGYYELDHEGVVGDLKTRFKYKPVSAKRFGLNTKELLLADEKELNQYVPLKKLATYREEGWKAPRPKILELKKKIKERSFGETSKSSKKHKKSQSNGEAGTEVVEILEDEKSLPMVTNDEMTQSRSSKRKRRQLKIPESRRDAYGLKSNSKKKK